MRTKLFFLVLFTSFCASAQIVNIPDANLKNIILAASPENEIAKDAGGNFIAIDTNGDSQIQVAEALVIRELVLWGFTDYLITNLTGLQQFINLEKFAMMPGALTAADFSGFTNLKELRLDNGVLTSLNITGCPNLEYLSCGNNDFTTLNIAGSNIKTLICNINDLTSLDVSGCLMLETIVCQENQLTDLNLSGLTNLKTAYAYDNNLESISVAGLSNLEELYLNGNQLTTLDLAGLSNLKKITLDENNFSTIDLSPVNLFELRLSFNPLISIDVSGQANLEHVGLRFCQLTSIDLSACTNLKTLNIDSNSITALNISSNPDITYVDFSDNQVSSIDLSNNSALTNFYCNNNNLQELNFSQCPHIYSVQCINNQLQVLNFKNNGIAVVSTAEVMNNPDGLYVCVDDEAEQQYFINNMANIGFDTVNNINFGSYCSFAPGGNYNTITGTVKYDFEGDGCDITDAATKFMRLDLIGSIGAATFTNDEGVYKFYTHAGFFNVTPTFQNNYFTLTPASAVVDFPADDNSIATHDFCISANGIHPDVEVVIQPIGGAQPGFDAQYQVICINKGTETVTGYMTFDYDNDKIDFVSAVPAPISNETGPELGWEYFDLAPFETFTATVILNLNGPMETPAVNNEDVLAFQVNADISGNFDDAPGDNSFTLNQTVTGSYDPNDITCLEGNIVSPAQIGDYLHYVVNFENTGTAPTSFIVVRVDVNPAQYDISTLRVLNSSHACDIRVTGNKIEFIMATAALAAGDHGNILFKMKTMNNLVEGNMVKKKASIFFDYNFPIVTNDANTTFQALSTGNWAKDESVKLYPNPSAGMVKIEASSAINSIELYDIQGRLLEVQKSGEMSTSLDIATRAKGIYFVKVITDKGAKVEKIIRE